MTNTNNTRGATYSDEVDAALTSALTNVPADQLVALAMALLQEAGLSPAGIESVNAVLMTEGL